MRAIKILLMLSLIIFLSFCQLGSRHLLGIISVYGQDWREQARQHYGKGKEYHQQGMYKEAQEEFQEALALISQAEKKPAHPQEVMEKGVSVVVKEDTKATQTPQVLEYTIGEEDVLYISVWQEKDLSEEVIVRPDGKISFSLAGDVPAAGLTFNQLKEELTQRLKDYIKYPVVSITIRKLGGKKVIVLGEVGSAGVYSVTGKCTVLEAIGRAGGFTPHAVPSSVILIRGGLQSPEGKRLNLSRAIDKTDMSQNVALQPEDVVYVPKKFIANVNYAVTQILGPVSQGAYTAKTFSDW